MDKNDSIYVKFDGTNYFSLEFQIRNFIQGHELCDFIDGTSKKPSSDDTADLAQWAAKNTGVICWILEPSIAINVRPYNTVAEMWKYFSKIYHQQNDARHFQLEYEIAEYNQGHKSVQEYYSKFMNPWSEYASLVCTTIPTDSIGSVQKVHESTQHHQFLMKLQREFKLVRVSLLNCRPSPSLDDCKNYLGKTTI